MAIPTRYADRVNAPALPEGPVIHPDGSVTGAARVLDLDAWADAGPELIRAAAQGADLRPCVVIGIANAPLAPHLGRLAESATVLLSGPEGPQEGREWVHVSDPASAAAAIGAAVDAHPKAALALAQLLRQTEVLPTAAGLAAEAAVYSMLLGGPEFTQWLTTRRVSSPPDHGDRALVRLRRTDDRLDVALDHPERRNALSFALREELFAALELALIDESITAVELTGTGPFFCSGGELAEFGTATDLTASYLVRVHRAPWHLIDRLAQRLGPRMAIHVHGGAVGAGAEIAAFAGHLGCTPDAFFALPELTMGLVPGAGGTVSLVRRLGRHRAAWLILTGARLDARTAVEWGLVDEILDVP
jgi:enoyl-CoA hydratase/carnithine racemase